MEGKLKASGSLSHLGLSGSFSISNGTVGDLKFDRAAINFTGELPYLPLEDSKVWIGNSSFLLKGGIDFQLRNFLRGIQVVNSEHVMIWRGLELSRELEHGEKGSVQEEEPRDLSRLVLSGSVPARLEGEYKVSHRASFTVTAEEDQNKREYLTAGPKVKF